MTTDSGSVMEFARPQFGIENVAVSRLVLTGLGRADARHVPQRHDGK